MPVKKRKKVGRKCSKKGEPVARHDQDTGIEMVKADGKWVPQDHAVWDDVEGEWRLPLPDGVVRLRGWEKGASNRDRPLCPICGTRAPGAMCLSALWGVPVHESCIAEWPDGFKVPACAMCGNAKLLPMVLNADGRAVHLRCLKERAPKKPVKEYQVPAMEVKRGSEKKGKVKKRKIKRRVKRR